MTGCYTLSAQLTYLCCCSIGSEHKVRCSTTAEEHNLIQSQTDKSNFLSYSTQFRNLSSNIIRYNHMALKPLPCYWINTL